MDVLVVDEPQAPSVIESSAADVLVVEAPASSLVEVGGEGDLIVMDAPAASASVVELEPDLLLVDAPAAPAVLQSETGTDVVVITSSGVPGPQGQTGATGSTGAQGPPGPQGGGLNSLTFSFAIPQTEWVMAHNLGTKRIEVNLFDHNGLPMVGEHAFPDVNTVTVSWFYPTTGSAELLY